MTERLTNQLLVLEAEASRFRELEARMQFAERAFAPRAGDQAIWADPRENRLHHEHMNAEERSE